MKSAWLVVLVGIGSACASRDDVIATVGGDVEAGAEAGPDARLDAPAEASDASPPPGSPCATSADCQPDQFCNKRSCLGSGGCEVRPPLCDATSAPVCGCDGVTYWNDCLRQRDGVASSSAGVCSLGAQCSGGSGTCPVADASCARLAFAQRPCPMSFPGVCWVLPDSCPEPPPPGPMWRACGQATGCTDLCQAIRGGMPSQESPGPGMCM